TRQRRRFSLAACAELLAKGANPHRGVLIRALKPFHARLLQDDPADAVPFPQSGKIRSLKFLPRSLSLHLFPPFVRDGGKYARHTAILVGISQAAALRCAAESDRILPPQIHIFRIERKYGVGGSVLPYPDESLSPGISRRASRPLDMHARREKKPLRHEHPDRQSCK